VSHASMRVTDLASTAFAAQSASAGGLSRSVQWQLRLCALACCLYKYKYKPQWPQTNDQRPRPKTKTSDECRPLEAFADVLCARQVGDRR
jgi:hypothetical protein